MKKFLLLTVVLISTLHFLNAQPYYTLEELGKGVLGKDTAHLNIQDLNSVDKVVVEAIAEIINPTGSDYTYPQDVEFISKKTKPASFNSIIPDNMLAPKVWHEEGKDYYYDWHEGEKRYFYFGYYTKTFTKSELSNDGKIVLDKKGQGDHILTFYAYVYRNNGTVEIYSKLADNKDRYFIYRNGKDAAPKYEYEFSLPPTENEKDVEIILPLSDNTDIDDRIGVLSLFDEKNTKKKEITFKLNNDDTNFQFIKQALVDVPATVSKIKLEIYSPDELEGDSFFSGVPIINVKEKPGDEPQGCTYTQGYWKNHVTGKKADPTWNVVGGSGAFFFKTKMTYLEVLNTPPKGNAYYILAHQYIAAELNKLAGADDSDIEKEFEGALDWFNLYGPDDVNKSNKNYLVDLADVLDDYNNGIIGPGHCDDAQEVEAEEEELVQTSYTKTGKSKGKAKGKKKSAQIEQDIIQINDLKVYPNPVTHSATISFTARHEGNVTVDLYNSLGQRTTRLMDRMVNKDFPVTLSINSQNYHEGLHILRVQNESSVKTLRIQIGR